jgi:hypothetical protein
MHALRESESTMEQARPYLLAVARLRLSVLDTTWSVGRNRNVEVGHVQELKEIFKTVGLERRAPENRIWGLCSAAEVQRVRTAATQNGQQHEEDIFLDWATINEGSKVEVMAGQHRIAALQAYVSEVGGQPGDLWWTCELYDRGTLLYCYHHHYHHYYYRYHYNYLIRESRGERRRRKRGQRS